MRVPARGPVEGHDGREWLSPAVQELRRESRTRDNKDHTQETELGSVQLCVCASGHPAVEAASTSPLNITGTTAAS